MRVYDYNEAWRNCPEMRPMYTVTRNITRGTTVLKKGAVIYVVDNSLTFLVPFEGNVSLPLAAVEFTGYGDVSQVLRATFGQYA